MITETEHAIDIALAWQAAANQQDLEQLLALSDQAIEIVGPRGVAYGHQVLNDWLARAGLHLTTERIFARGAVVVIAQHGVWRSPETGEIIGEAALATLLRMAANRVHYLMRTDDLATALAQAGLNEADEHPLR